jgi:putative membrane protein
MNRTVTAAIALAGLALGTGAVIWLGAGHILNAVLEIGWLGLVYVVSWQLAVFLMLGVAWWAVCPRVSVWTVVWARLVREGGETCLPFSKIGGLVFGARALMLSGVDFARAAASSCVDVVAEGIGLAPFLLFGLVMLLARKPGSLVALPMGMGLGVLVLGGTMVLLLRKQAGKLLRVGTTWLLKPWVKDAPRRANELQRALEDLFRQRGRVTAGSLIHALCWCGGGGNIWIAYHLLGAKPSVLDALAIESILSSVLAIGLVVPAGLGVQELTYVGVGSLFGIPGHLSLALSLIRRARDIIIGAPPLLVWQALEARQLHKADNG